MNNSNADETRKIAYETWRFQVDSYWTRNSYFAVFETAAGTGAWVVGQQHHYWTAMAFSVLGIALTLIWLVNNHRVHEYIETWWDLASDSDKREGDFSAGARLASVFEDRRKAQHAFRYSYLIQLIPVLFLLGWIYLVAFSGWQGYAISRAATKGIVVDAATVVNLAIQAAQVILLLGNLLFVWRYVRSTDRIKEASVAQAKIAALQTENMSRPVLVMKVSHKSNNPFAFENLGSGPALNVKYTYVRRRYYHTTSCIDGVVQQETSPETFEGCWNFIAPREVNDIEDAYARIPTNGYVIAQYESISGKTYWTKGSFDKKVGRCRNKLSDLEPQTTPDDLLLVQVESQDSTAEYLAKQAE